ncbi:P27 family phage terminase small subunit [bacterium]|nr:P27 family phage terminase small subunit [bacterium]
MPAGRPRKSIAEKKASGTFRKDREVNNPLVWESLTEIPEMEETIEGAKEYYKHACEALRDTGQLCRAFIPSIERAAFWYGLFLRASKEVETNGVVQTAKSGYSSQSPHVNIMAMCHKNVIEFENQFGLNLVSSQKIEMPRRVRSSGLLRDPIDEIRKLREDALFD